MRFRFLAVLFLCTSLRSLGQADDRLELKTKAVRLHDSVSGPGHIIVRFRDVPRREQLQELGRRGASVVGYVTGNAAMVSSHQHLDLSGLDVNGAARLEPEHKISPLVGWRGEAAKFVLVEFHPDVDPVLARRLLRWSGLDIHRHADLRKGHFLVSGRPERIQALAQYDEVAYIFPASDALLQGRPVLPCDGPITDFGPIGQYVASRGDGWDGPGQNPTVVGYVVGKFSQTLPEVQVRAVIAKALQEWARYVEIDFQPATDPQGPRTLTFLFATGSHGDDYPFDGPGGTLAHAYYPAPPNPEPIAGDLHFDDSERWQGEGGADLYSVVLHEIGHALGLAHSDDPNAIMYPYYQVSETLHKPDIVGIRRIYAPRGSPIPELYRYSP